MPRISRDKTSKSGSKSSDSISLIPLASIAALSFSSIAFAIFASRSRGKSVSTFSGSALKYDTPGATRVMENRPSASVRARRVAG